MNAPVTTGKAAPAPRRVAVPVTVGGVKVGGGAPPFRVRDGWLALYHGVDEAARYALGALLLDARTAERYRGDVEPIDPRAGHIPGAVSAPFTANLNGEPVPVFCQAEELRARYSSLGAADRAPVVYCGSGVTACHDLLALHLAGLPGRLYAGSWSEWSSDPERAVSTGSG